MNMDDIQRLNVDQLSEILWNEAPEIRALLAGSTSLIDARDRLFGYLAKMERHYFNIYSDLNLNQLHICERNNAKECIRVLKNVIRTENEILTGFSALHQLWKLAGMDPVGPAEIQPGFLAEFIFLFKGINGRSGIADEIMELPGNPQLASQVRSRKLNAYATRMKENMDRYTCGLDDVMKTRHHLMKQRILNYFKADEGDWTRTDWQMQHIITTLSTLADMVYLDAGEIKGLELAQQLAIPFQITPYYLSLFNPDGRCETDRAVRAQVLPSEAYCRQVLENRKTSADMDFMGEKSTSPIPGITRRYPQIVILKPIDTCPQICVYCQRNWEIKGIHGAGVPRQLVNNAIRWIRNNPLISEVLITGGDPLMLSNSYLTDMLRQLSEIGHVERIRIGSRVPVTLPFRIDDSLADILAEYHVPGRREICLVTHFEHPTEITAEALDAITRIRKRGISIYNQQVFTYYNSRRYETSSLRRKLKLAGIDPYYSFNTKGKAETADFRVPIARIQQERKEEARFLPGLVRTDEPVFNVPKLGKSHLRSWQDHEIIMINAHGERIYRFFPWESKVTFVDDYLYTDTSIYDYLNRLRQDGYEPDEYGSIWFYF